MKYYYPASRNHHAFCMSLDFGMKFSKRDGFWTPEGLLTITGAGGYKIEIAEESLGLLEPQVGDLVEYRMLDSTYMGKPPRRTDVLTATKDRPLHWPPFHPRLESIDRIIERGGKLFHWPEQEKSEGV